MPDWRCFDTTSDLDEALSETVGAILAAAVAARGAASLVVSGGSTPTGFFRRLAQSPLPWSSITVLLADERWVAADDKASNAGMVRRELLREAASAAPFVSLTEAFPDIPANLSAVCDRLDTFPVFDVVILGMGNDGHTASLFPCAEELNEGLQTQRPALMVHPTSAPHTRISLSKQRLLQTANGFVHIAGNDKRAVLEGALKRQDPVTYPIINFMNPGAAFTVYWAPKD